MHTRDQEMSDKMVPYIKREKESFDKVIVRIIIITIIVNSTLTRSFLYSNKIHSWRGLMGAIPAVLQQLGVRNLFSLMLIAPNDA